MAGELSHVPEVVKMGGKDHEEDVKLGEGLELGTIYPPHSYDGKSQGLSGAKPSARGYSMSDEETLGKIPASEKAGLNKMDPACQKAGLAWWTRASGDDIPSKPEAGARAKK